MLEFATVCASFDRALQDFLTIMVGVCIISWDFWLEFALIIFCGCLSGVANSNQKQEIVQIPTKNSQSIIVANSDQNSQNLLKF